MIEILNGIHETIHYHDSLDLRLFHNREYEDYPEHWHTGLEIIMVIEGEYGAVATKNEYALKEGDILVINSGVLHALKAPPTGERVILQFSDRLLYTVQELETILTFLPPVIYLSKRKNTFGIYRLIEQRMQKIIREYDAQRAFYQTEIFAQIVRMFVILARTFSGEGKKTGEIACEKLHKREYTESMMKVCHFINQHYAERITLDQVAKLSGFSKFHFSRIFKMCMQMTFYEYLCQKRIDRAEELLSTTKDSITQIALNSGFTSISSFNRAFLSTKKCSPSIYRNKECKSRKIYPLPLGKG